MSTNRQPRKIIADLHIVAFAFWQLSVSRFVYLSRVITINNLRHGRRCRYCRLRLTDFALHIVSGRSWWPRDLRHGSAAARLLGMWVRIPPGAWMSVCCECCVLSGRGLCDELITRTEESYQLWCVFVCDLET